LDGRKQGSRRRLLSLHFLILLGDLLLLCLEGVNLLWISGRGPRGQLALERRGFLGGSHNAGDNEDEQNDEEHDNQRLPLIDRSGRFRLLWDGCRGILIRFRQG
jgi:hypothetical protein